MNTAPHNRTIRECMIVSEQRGKDDWLSGASQDDCPYAKKDITSRAFWFLGWFLADGAFKE
jgi:ribosome modulation factor